MYVTKSISQKKFALLGILSSTFLGCLLAVAYVLSTSTCAHVQPIETADASTPDPFTKLVVRCPGSPFPTDLETDVLTCLNSSNSMDPCIAGVYIYGTHDIPEIACAVRWYGVRCAHAINSGEATDSERRCHKNASEWIDRKQVSFK